MQISRHWRMNSQRYRLEGVRYEDGQVSLQAKPMKAGGKAESVDIVNRNDLNQDKLVMNQKAVAVA